MVVNNIQHKYTKYNSIITSLMGLNIVCPYKRALLQPRSVMLWLTARNEFVPQNI